MMSHRPGAPAGTSPSGSDLEDESGPDDLPAAVLWDMDGTIVDTEPCWDEAIQVLVDEFGGHWSDADSLALIGTPLPRTAQILQSRGVTLPADEVIDRLIGQVVSRVRSGQISWRPGARELLAALCSAGVPNALVTMSFTPLSDAVLELLPEGTFTAVVTGDVVERGKPHPEPYLTAAAALGVEPAEAIAIEDSLPGVASAQSAGVPVIAVQNQVAIPEARGRLVTRTLEGLTPADLARIARRLKLVASLR
jgi:HAD superfamily hydrolase (TIGR01509 family)